MKQRITPIAVLLTGAGIFSLITIIVNPVVVPVRAWFVYQKGDPLSPQSYTRTIGSPGCPGEGVLCAVYADVSPDNQYQPSYKSLEELAAQSDNFQQEVPGLVEQRGRELPAYPGISGRMP